MKTLAVIVLDLVGAATALYLLYPLVMELGGGFTLIAEVLQHAAVR